ncbi:hydroxypyruvate isomerase [Sphaerotilus natans subsp. natans DSM 6575]|uniref:Hydroxypyruvate isomerase n=1 Tax=Sphaerotilus natans subsp. natans DSM 6575 TaxID=1286631 RepID=A0A059KHY0_9BURK|nr:2-oxo-tetronate isomerase [Sphaerotilus natans]KDB51021.1 hydroxypyruvate isomerase [Sphaerotilus natans subsp. natans DSM 6575]SIQ54735.1 hydroxypyruvate isomerase [Sphaerotilus natans]
MPRFAANLSLLYNEHAFLDRFAAAAADGFEGVEYLFPYAFPAEEIAARLKAHGLQQVLFNAPPGDWEAGERGLACLPGREAEFRAGFVQALAYAQVLDCPRIHVMAGIAPAGVPRGALLEVYQSHLAWAAAQAAAEGRDVLIEPINPRDMPGYFLNHQDEAHRIVQAIGAPNLKVQFDLYHAQIVEGDLAMKIRQHLPTGRVGHFQLAGVPMRHEPDLGELNYPYLFEVIDEVATQCGWQGWIGCEYRPARGAVAGATSAGLGWLRAAGVPARAGISRAAA